MIGGSIIFSSCPKYPCDVIASNLLRISADRIIQLEILNENVSRTSLSRELKILHSNHLAFIFERFQKKKKSSPAGMFIAPSEGDFVYT